MQDNNLSDIFIFIDMLFAVAEPIQKKQCEMKQEKIPKRWLDEHKKYFFVVFKNFMNIF